MSLKQQKEYNLNTSYVNVNLKYIKFKKRGKFNLNTSYVNVNPPYVIVVGSYAR